MKLLLTDLTSRSLNFLHKQEGLFADMAGTRCINGCVIILEIVCR